MQESIVKFVLFLIGLGALALGGVFLVVPASFVEFSESQLVNIGWLRGLGAFVLIIPGLSSLVIAVKRTATNPLLGFSALAITASTGTLWYGLFAGEFTADSGWTLVLPAILGTVAAAFLWIAWSSRRRQLVTPTSSGTGPAPAGTAADNSASDSPTHDPPTDDPQPADEQPPDEPAMSDEEVAAQFESLERDDS